MIDRKRLIDTFIELSRVDGIHGNEKEIANFLRKKLEKFNCSVSIDAAGSSFGGNTGNIIAHLNGNENKDPIFLCAHMDTIKSTANITHVISNDTIATDRSTILGGDDRAGIAVILEVLEVLNEQNIPHSPIEIVFTVCEEAGMHGAKFIKAESLKSKFGYVFDCQASPGNYIIEAPGAVSFTATFIGQSAHAAVSPEKGINAIFLASKAISQLKLGRWEGTGMLNVGTIEGGEAINVVPDKVTIKGETRNSDAESLETQVNYIMTTLKSVTAELGGEVVIDVVRKYGGYKFNGDERMIEVARKAITDSGLEPLPIAYPGGSDANVFNSNGIPALNLGVGFKNAHSFDEMIAINDLVKTAEIGLEIVLNHSIEERGDNG